MSRWIPSKVAVAVTIGLLTPFSVSAQDQSEKSTETMVVTASGFEQSMKEAPASISVISREDLEKGSYTSIVDAVSNIPGVYVTGGGNSQDISIRGMAAS
ncbi:MAG: TonB-dependent receptor plug domain-containing protein, partial [Vibrio sp.]